MTKKLISEIWRWTNQCYVKALLDEYPAIWPMQSSNLDAEAMKSTLAYKKLPTRSPSINTRYLDYLKKLSTRQLELVVEADRKEKIRRSPVTIHAIMDELFERSADPDPKEST